MQGRKENDAKKLKKIRELLIGKPDYMEDYLISMGRKTPGSKLTYIRYVLEFLNYLSPELDVYDVKCFKEIRPSAINKYMEFIGKGKGDSTKATKFYAISNFFRFLYFEGYISVNPCERIETPKIKDTPEVVAMSEEEVALVKRRILENGSIAEKWRKRDLVLFTLGCRSGLRVSALSEINMEDIDYENKSIRVVEKGDVEKIIYIGSNTMELIKDWIHERNRIMGGDEGALFVSNRKQRLSVRRIQEMIANYTSCLDKHITPHKMRSTCATTLYEKTGDIYAVQNTLGHKNIKNTMRYAKYTDEKKKQVANIMDEL